MPRILHIIPTFDRAGAEKQLLMLARGLPRDEFDVHVCALSRGGPLRDEFRAAGIPTFVIGRRLKADPVAFARLVKHIRAIDPDIVHTWVFSAGSYGRVAARAAGVPHIVAGEFCVNRWKSTWQWLVDRRLADATDRFVTNSPTVRDNCAEHGIDGLKFTIIQNGVEPA